MGRGGGGSDSFADAISRAGQRPENFSSGGGIDLPQLLGNFPVPSGEKIIDDTGDPNNTRAAGDRGPFEGITKFKMQAHFKRFMVGQQACGVDENHNVIFEPIDESEQYVEVLNQMLEGKAIARWEERSILKDGTVVIVMSYFTPREPIHASK